MNKLDNVLLHTRDISPQVELLKLEYTIEREFFYDGEDKSKIRDIFRRLKEMQDET